LAVSAAAGFNFPDRTGTGSLGAVLATVALLLTGGVLWLDARDYGFRPNLYAAIVFACSAGFFVARYMNLESWELVGPGAGFAARAASDRAGRLPVRRLRGGRAGAARSRDRPRIGPRALPVRHARNARAARDLGLAAAQRRTSRIRNCSLFSM